MPSPARTASRVRHRDLARGDEQMTRQLRIALERQRLTSAGSTSDGGGVEERVAERARASLPTRARSDETSAARMRGDLQPKHSAIARSDSSRISLQSLARSATISGDSMARG